MTRLRPPTDRVTLYASTAMFAAADLRRARAVGDAVAAEEAARRLDAAHEAMTCAVHRLLGDVPTYPYRGRTADGPMSNVVALRERVR